MIPLSPSQGLDTFPRRFLAVIVVLLCLDLTSRLWPGTRTSFLEAIAFHPSRPPYTLVSALIFFPNFFSLFFHSLFLWAFAPLCHARIGNLRFLLGLVILPALALRSFFWIHSDFSNPLMAPEALVSVLLGMALRFEIWGSTRTLVVGLFWLRIFDVPSYVLIFFYFFYLLVSNFWIPDFYNDAPMLYWVPFIGFISGFLWAFITNPKTSKLDQVDHQSQSPLSE